MSSPVHFRPPIFNCFESHYICEYKIHAIFHFRSTIENCLLVCASLNGSSLFSSVWSSHRIPLYFDRADHLPIKLTPLPLIFLLIPATGHTVTGTLHPPPHPAAQTFVTVTMLPAGEWPQWQQPRATRVTWTMTQSLCPHLPHPEANTCQRKRTMKAAHLLLTQRGATLTTSTLRRPLPVRTPPEEGPSSSDCLQRGRVHPDLAEIWRGGGRY